MSEITANVVIFCTFFVCCAVAYCAYRLTGGGEGNTVGRNRRRD